MGRISFQYRALYVVIAHVEYSLETEADVVAWSREYEAYFTQWFRRKVDLILELSQFHFSPKVAQSFAHHRALVLSRFTVRSYRVRQNVRERTFMYTTSARAGTPANQFDSIGDALNALLSDRETLDPALV